MEKLLIQSMVILITITTVNMSFINLDEDGSYNHIVVSVSPRVQKAVSEQKQFDQFVQNLKDFFTKVSEQLFIATRNRTFLGNISVLVPSSWPNDASISGRTFETYQESDIRVDTFNPYSKNQEEFYTQQPQGCGQPGNFIYIPYQTVQNWNGGDSTPVRRFIQEWAKFKYGVFEEYGYENDELFSNKYDTGDGIQHDTSCYNPNPCVENNDPQCEVKADSSFDYLQSSIMADVNLNGNTFCDGTDLFKHNEDAPTRQNILCFEKNTWDIISKNQGTESNQWRSPEMKLVRMAPGSAVLIIHPKLVEHFSLGKPVQTSIFKFIDDFPSGGQLAIAIADNSSNNIPLTLLTDRGSRLAIRKKLEKETRNSDSNKEDVVSAILSAEKMLISQPPTTGYIIIIGSGADLATNITLSTITTVMDRNPFHFFLITDLKDANFQPTNPEAINLNKHRSRFSWFPYSELISPSNNNCNLKFVLDNEQIFSRFFNKFTADDYYADSSKIQHSYFADGTFEVAGYATLTFKIYNCYNGGSPRNYELFVNGKSIFAKEDSNAYISFDWNANKKTIEYHWTVDGESGKELENSTASTVWMKITDPTKPVLQTALSKGEVIVELGKEEISNSSYPPVVIYGYFVNDQEVTASITSSTGSTSSISLKNNGMTNNGTDPDLKSNDGIYSGYYNSAKAGIYSVKLHLKHESTDLGLIYLPKIDKNSLAPKRIVDLRMLKLDMQDMIAKLKWTASADYFNQANVSTYALKCNSTRQLVQEVNTSTDTDHIIFEMQESLINYNWTIPEHNKTYYCTVWAVNVESKSSQRSNIIRILAPDPSVIQQTVSTKKSEDRTTQTIVDEVQVTTIGNSGGMELHSTVGDSTTTAILPGDSTKTAILPGDQEEDKLNLSTGELAGIVCGCIVLLVIIVIGVFLCIRWKKNRKKPPPSLFPHITMVPSQNNRSDVIRGQNIRNSIATIDTDNLYTEGGRAIGPPGLGNSFAASGYSVIDTNRYASVRPSPSVVRQRLRGENNLQESKLAKAFNDHGSRVPTPDGRISSSTVVHEYQGESRADSSGNGQLHGRELTHAKPPEVPKKTFQIDATKDEILDELYSKIDKSKNPANDSAFRSHNITEV